MATMGANEDGEVRQMTYCAPANNNIILAKKAINDLFALVDKDKSGSISFIEFASR